MPPKDAKQKADVDLAPVTKKDLEHVSTSRELGKSIEALQGKLAVPEKTDDEDDGEEEEEFASGEENVQETTRPRKLSALEEYRNMSEGNARVVDKITYNHERIEELFKYIDNQDLTVKGLFETIRKMQTQIDSLNSKVALYESGTTSKIESLERDVRKRVEEAVSIHRDTPELVERVIATTNKALNFLPEDLKENVSKIKLSDAENKTLNTIRSQITTPQKTKLPKHLRKYAQ